MNVQELFKTVDRDRLFVLYCLAHEKAAMESESLDPEVDRGIFDHTVDEILQLVPKPCENIDILLFEPNEGQAPYPEGELLGNVYGIGKEEAVMDWHRIFGWFFIVGFGCKRKWALDFTPWDEMVGLSVPDDVIAGYGADIVTVNIFWEMVFLGWTTEYHEERTQEILEDIEDACDDAYDIAHGDDFGGYSSIDIIRPGRRGLFWVICEFDENGEVSFPSTKDVQILTWQAHPDVKRFTWWWDADFNPVEEASDFEHEEVWKLIQVYYDNMAVVQEVSAYAWDHFPRGRVEINQGKAFVFHDPALCKMDSFRDRIIHLFSLDMPEIDEVVFDADKKS